MNCDLCNQHILATMQVAWNGGNYHADCIGEAVNRNRARTEIPSVESDLPEDYFQQLEDSMDEGFEDEFTDYENQDDLEDIINALDDQPVVSDEILRRIPPEQPERREVHISEVVAGVSNQFALERAGNGSVGTLISGKTTTLINREALKHLPIPETTDTFKPIPHHELVEQIHECLSFRRLSVVREEYAVSQDGMKLFGLLELNVEYAGVRFAIGLRNANDKSMRVGLVAGYRVTVCENKMLTGDFQPMLAKHSKNFNLLDALSVGVDRIQRNINTVNNEIERKKVTLFDDSQARNLIYRAFLDQRFPISLLRSVHSEYFVKPSYDEFKGNNLWALENAFTTNFKKLKPVQQFEAAAKLGKFLSPYISPF
jgi:hypothetical protein